MKQLQNTLYILTPETYLFLQNEAIAIKVGGVEKVLTRLQIFTVLETLRFLPL